MVALARPYRKNLKYPTQASAFYVAPNGSDAAAGSFAAPFLTFAKAQVSMRTGNKITYVRSGRTYLAAGITSGALVASVTLVGNMPASGSYSVVIDDETLTVTGGAGTTSWTVTRGALNTTAASHALNAPIDFVYSGAPPTTTLSVAMTDTTGTTVHVTSATGFPTFNNFVITVGTETMLVQAGAGTTTWTVIRNFSSISAATHLINAAVLGAANLPLNNDASTTWSNYPGEKPVFDMGGAAAGVGIGIESSNIWVNGIRFQNARNTLTISAFQIPYQNASAVQMYGSLGAITNGKLTNCECYNINPGADDTHCAAIIGFSTFTGWEVANCRVYNCGSAGIITFQDSGTHQAWVSDCIVHDVCLNTVGDNGAIYFWDNPGAKGAKCQMAVRNIVYNNAATAKTSGYTNFNAYAFYCDDQCSNVIWFGSWTYGFGSHSAHIHGGVGVKIHNCIHDMTSVFNAQYYQDEGGGPSMVNNVFATNIYYSAAATQPVGNGANNNSIWGCDFSGGTATTYPTITNSIYFSPNFTMVTNAYNFATGNATLDASPHVTNPLFRNPGSNDYALTVGSPALTLTPPFLPIAPGAGPSLAGIPPVWAAMPNQLLRNPDPTVGSVLASSAAGAEATGGTLPTDWGDNAGTALASNVYYIGHDPAGVPTIRIRWHGTTGSTAIQLNFDTTATFSTTGALVTQYLKFSICGGDLTNVGTFNIFVQANPSSTTLASAAFTPTGIPTWVVTPGTVAVPAATTSLLCFLVIGVTNGVLVDFSVEIGAPQVVH